MRILLLFLFDLELEAISQGVSQSVEGVWRAVDDNEPRVTGHDGWMIGRRHIARSIYCERKHRHGSLIVPIDRRSI